MSWDFHTLDPAIKVVGMELPPILDRKFAPEENRYINHIDNKLSELQRHEDDFGSCLLLLDHIEQLAWAVEARTPRGFPRPDSLRE